MDDTAKYVNIESSFRRFLIEEIYQGLGYPVLFGQAFVLPSDGVDTWISVVFNNVFWNHISTTNFDIYINTKRGYDDHVVNVVADEVRGKLIDSDSDSTDGWKRITLYKYDEVNPWTVIGYAQIIDVRTAGGVTHIDDVEGYRFKRIVPEVKWAAKI